MFRRNSSESIYWEEYIYIYLYTCIYIWT
jgi:hypothetical protein